MKCVPQHHTMPVPEEEFSYAVTCFQYADSSTHMALDETEWPVHP
jgi:hypothetical protein